MVTNLIQRNIKKKIQMKEFDIEKAKAGAPVCTRDGRPVRIICWDFQEYGQQEADEKFPIIALVKEDKGERAYVYRESGKCKINKNDELMMAPVKREGWINVYRPSNEGKYIVSGVAYETESEAKEAGLNKKITYITTIKIEWEE